MVLIPNTTADRAIIYTNHKAISYSIEEACDYFQNSALDEIARWKK